MTKHFHHHTLCYYIIVSERRKNILWPLWTVHICFLERSNSRSQWQRDLRFRSGIARLLGLWVRFPPGVLIFVCCECCVMSGRGLCDEPITRLERSYRLWCVILCDLETSNTKRPWHACGRSITRKNIKKYNLSKTQSKELMTLPFTLTLFGQWRLPVCYNRFDAEPYFTILVQVNIFGSLETIRTATT
jgi:hypothetical protein